MISWELAIDRYKVTIFYLEMLAIKTNPKICDAKKMIVIDGWNNNYGR
jgi:hypothetical protein